MVILRLFTCFAAILLSNGILADSITKVKPNKVLQALAIAKVKVSESFYDHNTEVVNVTATTVTATQCDVPKPSELIQVETQGNHGLEITVGQLQQRHCTNQFAPKSYEIDLGDFPVWVVKSISVNGVRYSEND